MCMCCQHAERSAKERSLRLLVYIKYGVSFVAYSCNDVMVYYELTSTSKSIEGCRDGSVKTIKSWCREGRVQAKQVVQT